MLVERSAAFHTNRFSGIVRTGAHLSPAATTRAPGLRWLTTLASAPRRAHYVVREMENRRIGRERYRGFLDRRRDELDVVPAILIRPCACPLEHLGTLLDSDDRAFGANPAFQSR